jgi:hypothetical protein
MLSNNPTVEKYTLRYAVGTVTGSIIILLGSYVNSPDEIDEFCDFFKENGFVAITGILLLGFAYSFIASCPLYVIHLNRFLLDSKIAYRDSCGKNPECCKNSIFQDMIILIVFTTITCSLFIVSNYKIFIINVTILNVIILISLFYSYMAFRCPQKVIDYYNKLCTIRSRRVDKEQTKFIAEISDSYKGLRENGNAFAIIVMQVLLYFSWNALDSLLNTWSMDDKIPIYLGLVAIWVLPGWFGMLAAHKIEADFMHSKPSPGNR